MKFYFFEFSIIKLETRKLIRKWAKYLNGHFTVEDI